MCVGVWWIVWNVAFVSIDCNCCGLLINMILVLVLVVWDSTRFIWCVPIMLVLLIISMLWVVSISRSCVQLCSMLVMVRDAMSELFSSPSAVMFDNVVFCILNLVRFYVFRAMSSIVFLLVFA